MTDFALLLVSAIAESKMVVFFAGRVVGVIICANTEYKNSEVDYRDHSTVVTVIELPTFPSGHIYIFCPNGISTYLAQIYSYM